jgi:hypothetical protein
MEDGVRRALPYVAAAVLLLLALGAALGLVLEAAAVLRPAGPTHALWYVLVDTFVGLARGMLEVLAAAL